MTSRLFAVCFAANEPLRVARFWSAILGREVVDDPQHGVMLLPRDETDFRLRFPSTSEPKVVQNRAHIELTSDSLEHQRQTVARALELGARHVDVGQLPEESHVVLGDPDGNEFCVLGPGNTFLAGCGFLGDLACDGSQAVGYFWSQALGWPLVWDQDQETAIQSPRGGPKIAWGGPPLMPNGGRDRVTFDVAPGVGDEPRAEVDRLLSLGATRVGEGHDGTVVLADPDGTEFRVLTPR
ncbi:VOC family protein [Micromonospora sp. STR1_7]|uniref:VOC family protein n=2 Tax=Micromonospora parastrephiae TaxID=2806101 RepID=A0ABS1XSD3_9ACTN|nr:VOC family protein [Micromonospora parastrephiae]MBM0232160.1 VOC family protein [Micromonospora parastrephiae]